MTKKQQQQAIRIIDSELERIEQTSIERTEELEEHISNIEINSQDFSRAIIEDVIKSVVSLRTDRSLGSGVVVADGGYVITNYHVIKGISKLAIYDVDEKIYSGKLIAINEDLDLALLQAIEGEDLPKLGFENENVYIGDKVIALGNPGGLSFSVTEGIISAVNRERNGNLYHQTDVSINPGSSGGPLVNLNKKIVGINTFKISGFEGVGFALTSDQVEDFVEESLSALQQG